MRDLIGDKRLDSNISTLWMMLEDFNEVEGLMEKKWGV